MRRLSYYWLILFVLCVGFTSSLFLFHPVTVFALEAMNCGKDSYDMLTYFYGNGQQTTDLSTDQYFTSVATTINGKPGFYIIKNKPGNVYEQFTYDANYIYHLRDTSWATENGNVQCNGHDAGFTLIDGCFNNKAEASAKVGTDLEGQKWVPRCMKKGQEYSFPGTTTAFDKTTCQACNAPFTGCATRIVKLTEVYTKDHPLTFDHGVTVTDGVKIEILQGSGAGEAYVYDRQHGWVGFGRTTNINSYAVRYEPALSYNIDSNFACKVTPGEVKLNDSSEYYISPLLGFQPKNSTEIASDLIKQGYEARCAAPGFAIKLEQSGVEWMERYLSCGADGKHCNSPNNGGGSVLGGLGIGGRTDDIGPNPIGNRVTSLLSVDYRDALIPIFRDLDQVPQLKRSLEDYFGYKSPPNDSYSAAELKSAPINSLLSRQERCTQSARSLRARDEMCKKLKDPSTCALYSAAVPDSKYTVKTLWDDYQAFLTKAATDDYKACGDLMGVTDSDSNFNLKQAMLNLPLQIENAYRLAFLVTTIRTKVPLSGHMMNLFQHPKRGPLGDSPDPAHVVIVTAFKVPDITTNKIAEGTPSGDTHFDDPAILTRNVLIPSTVREKLDADGQEQRKQLLDTFLTQVDQKEQDDHTMEIQCMISGVSSQQCKDPLTRALVDIINSQSLVEKANEDNKDENLTSTQKEERAMLECDDNAAETPTQIFDPADLHPLDNPGRRFSIDYGVALLEHLFDDETHLRDADSPFDPTYADTNTMKKDATEQWGLKSIFHVIPGNRPFGDDPTLRAVKQFIVYPEGYDLKTVEAVLGGTFFSSQQIEQLQDKSKDYQSFEVKDDKVSFEGGNIGHTYTDHTVRKHGVYCGDQYFSNGEWKVDPCPERSFSFTLAQTKQPHHAGILGGRLGFWIHTIQQSLYQSSSAMHAYLQNCASTEEFLLDQCGGATTNNLGITDASTDFNNIPRFNITYWNGADVTFQPPSQELWSDITSSAVQNGCDPWLVLALAHAESTTYTNDTVPNGAGEVGLYHFDENTWTKWKTSNDDAPSINTNHQYSSCDFWQPTTFRSQNYNFSSRSDLRANVDMACRRALWTGMQAEQTNRDEFLKRFADAGSSPDKEAWKKNDAARADYVYRLWNELLKRSGKPAKFPPAGYPYNQCMGTPPTPAPVQGLDYNGRTELPMTGGIATYYSSSLMNIVLHYRERAEINPSLIEDCELDASGSVAQQWAQVQQQASTNGSLKVVGCAAMLRLGDIPFYGTNQKNNVRTVWIKRPSNGSPDMPDVIGPIAIIDVANKNDAPNIYQRFNGKWVLDLDYNTFNRLFNWKGGNWVQPSDGIMVCDTKEQCQ